METLIDDSTRIFEIQEIFNNHFPYLKLEFFDLDPTQKKNYSKSNLITNVNKTIGEIRHIHRTGYISMNGHQKVSTLEKNFFRDFGINVQVFRKSGNTWLQTTSTDEWTLGEQNNMAESISKFSEETPLREDDYLHEQP
jgi:hypothetical protein